MKNMNVSTTLQNNLFPTALIAGILVLVLPISSGAEDRTSKVPFFTFSEILEEQEKELANNPLLKRFRESRQELLKHPHYPRYHFTSPENQTNDPNGLSYWNGKWHMFYQGYPPEDPRQHWGHAISDDLIHWRDLPYAIYPNPEDKCYSGSVYIEDDRAIAIYHGVEEGTMVAVSDDPLLLNWEKVTGAAVIPFPKPGEPPVPYNIFDPCIWKHDNTYYALTAGARGGKQSRTFYLHRSEDLADWEYLHPFVENDRFGLLGDDGATPYFWPIGDRHILIHFSHMSGGKYIIGEYDTTRQKFIAEEGGDFNFGSSAPGGVHAPSAFPDSEGNIIVIFNMNEAKETEGFDRIMSLPRKLSLREDFFHNPLNVEPAGDIESLRGEHVHLGPMTIPANREIVLEGVEGNSMEVMAEFEPHNNQSLELKVLRSNDESEYTRILFMRNRGYRIRGVRKPCVVSIDTSRSSLASDVKLRPPETAQVELSGLEPLKIRVFIDRSVVEVFINGRQCVATRVYPENPDSLGVSIRALGNEAHLTYFDAWQMKSIY